MFSKKIFFLPLPQRKLAGYRQPANQTEAVCHLKSNAHVLLLSLTKQEMKDQMSNSSMQALAERKNRQVRIRNGQVK